MVIFRFSISKCRSLRVCASNTQPIRLERNEDEGSNLFNANQKLVQIMKLQ